jgi:hypothetical protein
MARRHLATMGLSSAPVTAVIVAATLSAGWLAGHGASAQSLCTSPDNTFRVKVDLFASELGTRIALERPGTLVLRGVSHPSLLLASCALLLCDAYFGRLLYVRRMRRRGQPDDRHGGWCNVHVPSGTSRSKRVQLHGMAIGTPLLLTWCLAKCNQNAMLVGPVQLLPPDRLRVLSRRRARRQD